MNKYSTRTIASVVGKIEINNHEIAHVLCKVIPPYCPFERDIQVFGNKLFHIPPLCKLNPLYEQIVSLRFKSLCYLADICGEDITIQNGLRPAALTKFTH
ncbi:MAG: nitrogenase [Scytonema sp. CRU_2_7]|nr:nitrogenase [Scytonema sp. CRU_2_7]